MGLEYTELILALEEAFGIQFEEKEISKVTTPRMLGDIAFSRLQHGEAHACQTHRAFCVLRREMASLLGLRRRAITLDTPLDDAIPKKRRKEIWPRLRQAVGARSWPDLVRPRWVTGLSTAASLAVTAACLFSLLDGCGLLLGFFLGCVFLHVVVVKLTVPLRTCIPRHIGSVRDLIPYALTSNEVKWTREGVSIVLKKAVMDVFALPEAKYFEDADFVHDLGMG